MNNKIAIVAPVHVQGAMDDGEKEGAEARAALEFVGNLTVDSPATYEIAASMLKQIKGHASRLDATRKGWTGPLSDVVKDINATFKKALEPLGLCEKALKAKILGYRTQAEKDRALLLEHAGANPDVAETAIAEAAALEPPKVEGLQIRRTFVGSVTDAQKIPREYLIPDVKALNPIKKATLKAAVKEARTVADGKTDTSRPVFVDAENGWLFTGHWGASLPLLPIGLTDVGSHINGEVQTDNLPDLKAVLPSNVVLDPIEPTGVCLVGKHGVFWHHYAFCGGKTTAGWIQNAFHRIVEESGSCMFTEPSKDPKKRANGPWINADNANDCTFVVMPGRPAHVPKSAFSLLASEDQE